MKVAGIDVGSTTAKAVVLCDDTMYHGIQPIENTWQIESERILQRVLDQPGLVRQDLNCIVATGLVDENWEGADEYLSDISCAANVAKYYFPTARTVIDIGAENCRVTKFDEMSLVVDYRINQKCGAGTGLFLDVVADALEVDINETGKMSLKSTKKINMNSACAVFAESEVISLIHQGEKRADILAAVFNMIAAKTAALARSVKMEKEIAFIGGVARNIGMAKALSQILMTTVLVPENPDLANALGAAIEASEMV